MKFRATLELNGKTATGFVVPDKIVTGLGSSRRPAVRVTIQGHTYRSTIASMGGRYLVGVSAENRAAAGVAAGDTVDVVLELDTEPRVLEIPPDFAKALRRAPEAKRVFEGLSYSKKRQLVEPVEQAKTAETRERRITKAVESLRAGKA